MHCPYCISEIDDKAIVCPSCQRDLYLFKPLLSRLDALETRLDEQEKRLAQLGECSANAESDSEVPAFCATELRTEAPSVMPRLATYLSCCLLPLALLVMAHGLITVVYDLNTVFLRIVSLLIPLPFGLLLVRHERRPVWLLWIAAIGLSVSALLAMSWIVSRVDGVPVLPTTMREWRELAEYAASISLSYTSGMIVGQMLRNRARRQLLGTVNRSLDLGKLVKAGAARTEQVQVAAKHFHDLGSSLMASATTAASIFTGLRGFFND